MSVMDLPPVNATLNGLAGLLVLLGWRAIKRGQPNVHQRFMIAAVATSALFLACYLTYHFNTETVTRFPERYGHWRTFYLAILLTHTILAAATVPLVLITLRHALKNNLAKHRRLARWTLPIWLYVSVTGVVIYFMLYQWFPG
ncbi:MAG: hypothetical protein CMJ18_21340 [Phycisphaeraceae bacterium]|nr:hypothetical protein [Phycisphaeraceae bacterium]